MVFWLTLIVLLIGIGLIVIGVKNSSIWHDSILKLIGEIITVISGIIFAFMLFYICCRYMTIDAFVLENKERYNALTYKVESEVCHDEFGLLSKEVIDEVQDWNEDVVYYQNIQDNFWVGIFYPDVFDQFDTIDYERYNTN